MKEMRGGVVEEVYGSRRSKLEKGKETLGKEENWGEKIK